jgi:hypothetical protein
MRRFVGLSAVAVLGGSACILMSAAHVSAQISNANWGLPNSNTTNPGADNASGTDYLAEYGTGAPAWSATATSAQQLAAQSAPAGTGWYMSPAANPDFGYTNTGARDQFYSVEPIVNPGPPATGWSFWLQTFTQSGLASQIVSNDSNSNPIVGGDVVTFTSQMSFQDGSGPGLGFNAVTLANQTEASPVSPNTGDLNAYLEMVFLSSRGGNLGSDITNIPAGSVGIYNATSGPQNSATPWVPYSVTGTAPAGTASVEMLIGWNNGGLDGNTGGQSAFADDAVITVPEPATMSMLALGSAALFLRRRSKTAV